MQIKTTSSDGVGFSLRGSPTDDKLIKIRPVKPTDEKMVKTFIETVFLDKRVTDGLMTGGAIPIAPKNGLGAWKGDSLIGFVGAQTGTAKKSLPTLDYFGLSINRDLPGNNVKPEEVFEITRLTTRHNHKNKEERDALIKALVCAIIRWGESENKRFAIATAPQWLITRVQKRLGFNPIHVIGRNPVKKRIPEIFLPYFASTFKFMEAKGKKGRRNARPPHDLVRAIWLDLREIGPTVNAIREQMFSEAVTDNGPVIILENHRQPQKAAG